MKIDRFVKVMLVLIAMLLALNCVNNLSNTSDSGRNSSLQPPGHSRTPLIENKVEAAPPPTQYKAVRVNNLASADNASGVQNVLDQMSGQGWEYVGSALDVLIFKK